MSKLSEFNKFSDQLRRLNDKEYGYDWAFELNDKFKQLIQWRSPGTDQLSGYSRDIAKAITASEHYIPLI